MVGVVGDEPVEGGVAVGELGGVRAAQGQQDALLGAQQQVADGPVGVVGGRVVGDEVSTTTEILVLLAATAYCAMPSMVAGSSTASAPSRMKEL
jgi:hypothetical protein